MPIRLPNQQGTYPIWWRQTCKYGWDIWYIHFHILHYSDANRISFTFVGLRSFSFSWLGLFWPGHLNIWSARSLIHCTRWWMKTSISSRHLPPLTLASQSPPSTSLFGHIPLGETERSCPSALPTVCTHTSVGSPPKCRVNPHANAGWRRRAGCWSR